MGQEESGKSGKESGKESGKKSGKKSRTKAVLMAVVAVVCVAGLAMLVWAGVEGMLDGGSPPPGGEKQETTGSLFPPALEDHTPEDHAPLTYSTAHDEDITFPVGVKGHNEECDLFNGCQAHLRCAHLFAAGETPARRCINPPPTGSDQIENMVGAAIESNKNVPTDTSGAWSGCPEWKEVLHCNLWQIDRGEITWPPTGNRFGSWYDIDDNRVSRWAECVDAPDNACCWARDVDPNNRVRESGANAATECLPVDDCVSVCAAHGRPGSNGRCAPANSEAGHPNSSGYGGAAVSECHENNMYRCMCGAAS